MEVAIVTAQFCMEHTFITNRSHLYTNSLNIFFFSSFEMKVPRIVLKENFVFVLGHSDKPGILRIAGWFRLGWTSGDLWSDLLVEAESLWALSRWVLEGSPRLEREQTPWATAGKSAPCARELLFWKLSSFPVLAGVESTVVLSFWERPYWFPFGRLCTPSLQ